MESFFNRSWTGLGIHNCPECGKLVSEPGALCYYCWSKQHLKALNEKIDLVLDLLEEKKVKQNAVRKS
jgi:uncharacterized OB-fold protein